jgi:hypothetical protein
MPIMAEIETEVAFLGDERAARALVLENDGLHNSHEVTGRAIEAHDLAEVRAEGVDAA